jgi:hypothetical protein
MSNIVFFPDNENFKNRNFPMVHRLLREFGLQPIFDNPPEVKSIRFYLKGIDTNYEKAINENRYLYNIDLFEIVGAEYRRYINARSLSESITFQWSDILKCRFEKLDTLAMKDLLSMLNEANAHIEYYRDKLFIKRPLIVFVFGGSKIYQRACLKICELYNLNTFVLEHFFTGNHVYIEPQFDQIQNNKLTIERVRSRCRANTLPLKPVHLVLANLNVKEQPNTGYADIIFDIPKTKTLGCVFLQVFDDYSLANVDDEFVLSTELDRIVGLALKQNDQVLLKLHPFEYTKHGSYPTRDYLANKFFEETCQNRIHFIEGMLEKHISRINNWYGIVSQYALDLTLSGHNPICNKNFFFNDILNSISNNEKSLCIHEIAEHGLFSRTEKSFDQFIQHVSDNLLPCIGCAEADIEEFHNKVYSLNKAGKVVLNNQGMTSHISDPKNRPRKIRNAIRLFIFDPRTFKAKLFAKLGF